MEEVKDYKLHVKKVKIITGATAEEVDTKAAEFQTAHEVTDIIQKSEKLMFMFYWGVENEGEGNK